jgi:GNAT superfamily N-acetyltransferase
MTDRKPMASPGLEAGTTPAGAPTPAAGTTPSSGGASSPDSPAGVSHSPSSGDAPFDAAPAASIRIRRLESFGEREIRGLSDVLIDCVEGGASVSFMWPMTREKAEAFWRAAAAGAARGDRAILVAEDSSGEIVGTVQVVWAQPENQPHRGDVAKMLVHRRARRRGVGAELLAAAERVALDAGKTLLVLDTVTGGDAERMYARQGWTRCGVIPDYALFPDGRPCATTVFFKSLRA